MALNYQKVMSLPLPEVRHRYTEKDTMLYALGVGVAQEDATDPAELRFCFERDLQALPTLAAVLGSDDDGSWAAESGIDFVRMLHGGQSLTVHRPLPASGEVLVTTTVDEIYDKGVAEGAIMVMTRSLRDAASGELWATTSMTAMLRGDGGCGGNPGSGPAPHPVPERAADHRVEVATRQDQALLYRLNGDFNPLHSDPAFAAMAGFERPILHGLCTYGIACRQLIRQLCGNDAARVTRLDARFSAPVMPGDRLLIEIWNDAPGQAGFRCSVPARGVLALNNGLFCYRV